MQTSASPSENAATAGARPTLSVLDAIGIIVGIVIGAGIYETPSLVAGNAGSPAMAVGVWVLGGVLSLLGALCFAELATAFPHPGGTYYHLRLAFGSQVAFLYAWSRLAVIQTGSIALLGFVFGDYASQLLPLGGHSSAIYAAAAAITLTAMNVAGVSLGKWTQNLLAMFTVIGLTMVVVAGLTHSGAAAPVVSSGGGHAAIGMMMIFVLLTYGGWSEAAFISAELKNVRRNMVVALAGSIALITAVYVLVNFALVRSVGLAGMARSNAVAADLLRNTWGMAGAAIVSLAAMFAALSSMNATVFTGARTNYALGRDFRGFRFLGAWEQRGATPARGLLFQGAIALALIGLATYSRNGFKTMVEYTAPVFWLFITLAGIALFVLRRAQPDRPNPFRVPGYPVVPLLFSGTSAYLLYSSLRYTGWGAAVGVAVLGAGVLLLAASGWRQPSPGRFKQRRVA